APRRLPCVGGGGWGGARPPPRGGPRCPLGSVRRRQMFPGMTSPPAIEPRAGITVFTSMFGEIVRTEPSPIAKFMMPPAWKLPHARLHWLAPLVVGGVVVHRSYAGIRVRLWPVVTTDRLYDV